MVRTAPTTGIEVESRKGAAAMAGAFAAALVAARTERGLTQQQVADRVGKPQSYIAKVEGAERRLDVVEFIALAYALGVDPTTLFKNVLNAESVN